MAKFLAIIDTYAVGLQTENINKKYVQNVKQSTQESLTPNEVPLTPNDWEMFLV